MKKITLSFIGLLCCGILFAQTYTFTNASATGYSGPNQAQIDAAYSATSLDGLVTINTQGVQEWTVPASGAYSIQVWGAQGGNSGGQGAYMSGEFNLIGGEVLKIIVGQQGQFLGFGSGGGGGSFVTTNTNSPLIIAGGGGGAGHLGPGSSPPDGGQITTNGTAGYLSSAGLGGTAGNGGESSSSYGGTYNNSGGGGGLLTNGVGDGTVSNPGMAFVNGGAGGADTGGFGGGGGGINQTWNCSAGNGGGSGGGGYSGGGGGGGSCNGGGGGGGSYNSGTNQINTPATNVGNGSVVITSLCSPTTLTADVVSLSDLTSECSVAMPTAPTATNDCGASVDGTPDVTFPVSTQGTTVVTWTYYDGVSTITQTQNVVITDITAPVPDMVSLPDTTYECIVDSLEFPTGTDNCAGVVLVTNDAILPITNGGTTVVTWTYDDGNGNTFTQTQNIMVNTADVGIVLNGSQLNATGLGAYYQWLDCDNSFSEIVGEVNQFYTPATTGNYAVEVTQGNCVDTSVCLLVDFTGISELNSDQINIYPNPSSGNFSIDYDGELKEIEIMDVLGWVIEANIKIGSGKVDASALNSGKYLVRIVTENGVLIKGIIIRK